MWSQIETGERLGSRARPWSWARFYCGEGGPLPKKERRFAKKSPEIRVFGVWGVESRAGALVRLVPGSPREGARAHQLRLEVAGGPAGAVRRRRLRPRCVRPTRGWAPVVRRGGRMWILYLLPAERGELALARLPWMAVNYVRDAEPWRDAAQDLKTSEPIALRLGRYVAVS
jgi:hypothetical protein